MIHINPTNKTQKFIIASYLLIMIIVIGILYVIITNFMIANSIDSTLVQTHTTQLNIDDFNKILQQIKSDN